MQLPKMNLPDVDVVYVNLHKNKLLRYLIFIREFNRFIRSNKFDLIFHVHTKYTLVIRLLNLIKPIVLDIRTGDLSNNNIVRYLKNRKISLIAFFYRHVSVISESLAKEVAIPEQKSFILPLGGEFQDIPTKNFKYLKLLYVGTIDNRNIHDTVYGLSEYIKRYPWEEISYDIVGTGSKYWLRLLNKAIADTNLSDKVSLHGSKSLSEVLPFFEICNIGIVYIPQKEYYEFQPSTKLYESLLAGMPVIATNTYENRFALKEECGILTEDDPASFCNALEKINTKKHLYDSDKIKMLYRDHGWDNIVKNKLEKYIEYCCE